MPVDRAEGQFDLHRRRLRACTNALRNPPCADGPPLLDFSNDCCVLMDHGFAFLDKVTLTTYFGRVELAASHEPIPSVVTASFWIVFAERRKT